MKKMISQKAAHTRPQYEKIVVKKALYAQGEAGRENYYGGGVLTQKNVQGFCSSNKM
jgi:hypothetical protein